MGVILVLNESWWGVISNGSLQVSLADAAMCINLIHDFC